MFRMYERKAEIRLKRAKKLGLPEWISDYVRYKIDRAKYFRAEADSESAKILRTRDDRFKKAIETVLIALEISEEYIRHTMNLNQK